MKKRKLSVIQNDPSVLPNDMLKHIFSYLSPRSYCSVAKEFQQPNIILATSTIQEAVKTKFNNS